ncbi:dihydroorotase [Pseudalkalibacillus salsuginis]|uniref:dihydroorotase n=1 Tax=Pseudalkalibacillus salsuginis TaxID=2910972 RepID=UPI001F1C752C|nr:dihydroorotase [Pseudalkalibacillus salsuginis]MCF6410498.1 dihydroorotase [Pseudalkalibacillus salsuginis]
MGILLKNARVWNEESRKLKDVLILDSKVAEIGSNIDREDHEVIDAEGKLLAPGFVDLHVHLREPGGEHKETIETGTKAAAKGGFTTIAAMPNTRPVPDSPTTMMNLQKRIKETAVTRVLPYASITVRQIGDELVDFETLKQEGAFAFTDDGVGIQNADKMLQAMQRAAALDMAIVAHCEENSLIHNGCVHEGEYSKANGLNGIPSVCESVQIARDVLLAEATGVHYHVCHISTKESVRVVRDAKKAGINVTAEVTPHHLLLCEDDIVDRSPDFKMNPPLRSKEDREALIEGLLDGTIDFIATDHAPHAIEEKSVGIERAPFGIVGLETAFPLLYTYLVQPGICNLDFLISRMTTEPSRCFGLPYGRIEVGAPADLVVIDLEHENPIQVENFASKGRNTPFKDRICNGWPILTFVAGKVAYKNGSVFAS